MPTILNQPVSLQNDQSVTILCLRLYSYSPRDGDKLLLKPNLHGQLFCNNETPSVNIRAHSAWMLSTCQRSAADTACRISVSVYGEWHQLTSGSDAFQRSDKSGWHYVSECTESSSSLVVAMTPVSVVTRAAVNICRILVSVWHQLTSSSDDARQRADQCGWHRLLMLGADGHLREEREGEPLRARGGRRLQGVGRAARRHHGGHRRPERVVVPQTERRRWCIRRRRLVEQHVRRVAVAHHHLLLGHHGDRHAGAAQLPPGELQRGAERRAVRRQQRLAHHDVAQVRLQHDAHQVGLRQHQAAVLDARRARHGHVPQAGDERGQREAGLDLRIQRHAPGQYHVGETRRMLPATPPCTRSCTAAPRGANSRVSKSPDFLYNNENPRSIKKETHLYKTTQWTIKWQLYMMMKAGFSSSF